MNDKVANFKSDNKLNRFKTVYKRIKYILVGLFGIGLFISLIAFVALVAYFHSLTQHASQLSDNELKEKVLHFAGDSVLNHDRKNVLQEYDQSENSLIVGPHHVSPNVIKALTSSEDTLFYKHNGILPKALVRAMVQDVFKLDQSTGGSTITQQLVKNQVLSSKKTYSRKANELILAMRLENLLSKDEIIYTYLNIVPFGRDYNGNNITGIASASYSLFGIPPSELNVAQSAYLIGLLQSPYMYTPYNMDGTLKPSGEVQLSIHRKHYVLKRMLIEEVISKKEYNQAKNFNIYKHLLTNPNLKNHSKQSA
ncbi:transglycosylase domain-containing protein [Staphylococcus devriesei]|uniref:Transglycosylase n=1 Tax=Staphylococcus devriesei TaxID=586733 RepID=A0A2T4KW60_9STAP|nr:transglycosylase domain-containing protein [Staphylococcus devriesei]PTF13803.1 transglycosylase [Staphylococcus devriesei]